MRDPWHIWRICQSHRFAICCTPRCGSQSAMMWFGRSQTAQQKNVEQNGEWLTPVQRNFVAKNYYTLALTRDPWSRLVSAYLGKIVKHQKLRSAREMIQNVHDLLGSSVSVDEGITFRQFVYAIRMIDDDHWRPVLDFIPMDPQRTCTLATLRTELTLLAEDKGLPHTALPAENRARYGRVVNGAFDMMPRDIRQFSAYPRWDSFYDEGLRREVEQRYSRDIKRFGLNWKRAMIDLEAMHGKDDDEQRSPEPRS